MVQPPRPLPTPNPWRGLTFPLVKGNLPWLKRLIDDTTLCRVMARPSPLPVWDRQQKRLFEEFSDDLKSTYETRPRRSPTAWLEAQPWYDWMVSAMQNTSWTARNVQPFIESTKSI